MFKTHTTNDRITAFAKPALLRDAAFGVLDKVQTIPAPEVRYLAPLAVAAVIAQQLGRDIHEDIQGVRRMICAAEGPFTDHFQAMRDYVTQEIAQ